jgi:D-inositol-3-phosphate glycosyltransferase
VIHSHYWLSAVAGEDLATAWSVPHVAMFHTLAEVKLRARASERESEVRLKAERRLVRSVDRIVAATKHERQLLRQIYGVSADRVEVIPLGVNLSRFHSRDRVEARRALGLDLDRHVLLAVGRIEPLKGLDILIEAIAQMTERDRVVLLIVGGDDRAAPQIARLRAQAVEAGVADRVRFLGAVPHEQLGSYYNAADVVVVPSFYESFGLVAVEAMASGVPVVASRVGGLASTVIDGRTGYLVPWRCPDPFAEKLDLLLKNPSLRHALGEAAADSMLAYEWSTVAAKLRELYAAVLAGRGDLAAVGGG